VLSLQARANFALFVGLRGLRFSSAASSPRKQYAKLLPWALRSITGALIVVSFEKILPLNEFAQISKNTLVCRLPGAQGLIYLKIKLIKSLFYPQHTQKH
jgi:hypothetical protein